jgi:hypothetical protein
MGIAWKCIFTFLTMLRNSVLNFLYEKNIFLYVLKWCFFVCVVYRQIRCKIAPVQFSKNYTVFEWKIAQRYQSFGVCFFAQFMRMWCARYSYWINLLVLFLPFWSSHFFWLKLYLIWIDEWVGQIQMTPFRGYVDVLISFSRSDLVSEDTWIIYRHPDYIKPSCFMSIEVEEAHLVIVPTKK